MSQDFEILAEDVFSIAGRGSVVTGRIVAGSVAVGDRVLASTESASQPCTVTGIHLGKELVDSAETGATVGLLLRGFNPDKLRGALGRREDGTLALRVHAVPPGYEPPKPWWKFW